MFPLSRGEQQRSCGRTWTGANTTVKEKREEEKKTALSEPEDKKPLTEVRAVKILSTLRGSGERERELEQSQWKEHPVTNTEVLICSLPLASTSVIAAASRSSKQPVLAFIVSPGSCAPRAPSCGDRPWDQHTFFSAELMRAETRSFSAHAPHTPSAACVPHPGFPESPTPRVSARCSAKSLRLVAQSDSDEWLLPTPGPTLTTE